MTMQSYLGINTQNVVENIVYWDGGPDWTPPAGYTMLVQATTPAMVWVLNKSVTPNVFQLEEVVGAGGVGFTYNPSTGIVTTFQPQPEFIAP